MKSNRTSTAKGNAMKVILVGGGSKLVPVNLFQSYFNANKSSIVGYTRGHLC